MTFYRSLQEEKARIDASYTDSGDTFYAALFDGVQSSFSFTCSSGSAVIAASGHNFVTGMRVFHSGTLPGSIVSGTKYWIVSVVAGVSYQISATRGGTAIVHDGAGSGTVTEAPAIEVVGGGSVLVQPLTAFVRHEIDYNESPGRKELTFPAATIDYAAGTVIAPVNAVFTPSVSVNYRYLGILRGATGTAGNSTGLLVGVEDFLTDQVLPTSGRQFTYRARL